MELLINELMKRGARARHARGQGLRRRRRSSPACTPGNVGERNTAFVLDYLKTERIPRGRKDVLDIYPRKVCFLPRSGKAMVKRAGEPAQRHDPASARASCRSKLRGIHVAATGRTLLS